MSATETSRVMFLLMDAEAYLEKGESAAAIHMLTEAITALTNDPETARMVERIKAAV